MSTTVPRTRPTLLGPQAWLGPESRNRQIAVLGVILAALGVWLMLPPLGDNVRERTDSYELIPVYLGLLALFCGLAAVLRDEPKWGWAANISGLLAIMVGFAAAKRSSSGRASSQPPSAGRHR